MRREFNYAARPDRKAIDCRSDRVLWPTLSFLGRVRFEVMRAPKPQTLGGRRNFTHGTLIFFVHSVANEQPAKESGVRQFGRVIRNHFGTQLPATCLVFFAESEPKWAVMYETRFHGWMPRLLLQIIEVITHGTAVSARDLVLVQRALRVGLRCRRGFFELNLALALDGDALERDARHLAAG